MITSLLAWTVGHLVSLLSLCLFYYLALFMLVELGPEAKFLVEQGGGNENCMNIDEKL